MPSAGAGTVSCTPEPHVSGMPKHLAPAAPSIACTSFPPEQQLAPSVSISGMQFMPGPYCAPAPPQVRTAAPFIIIPDSTSIHSEKVAATSAPVVASLPVGVVESSGPAPSPESP